jgi:hypothetical protein
MSETFRSPKASAARPPEVQAISWRNIERLGVGQDGDLYWDGRAVVTRSRLDFGRLQKIGAVLVALAVILGGLGAFMAGIDAKYEFGWHVHRWSTGCPH